MLQGMLACLSCPTLLSNAPCQATPVPVSVDQEDVLGSDDEKI